MKERFERQYSRRFGLSSADLCRPPTFFQDICHTPFLRCSHCTRPHTWVRDDRLYTCAKVCWSRAIALRIVIGRIYVWTACRCSAREVYSGRCLGVWLLVLHPIQAPPLQSVIGVPNIVSERHTRSISDTSRGNQQKRGCQKKIWAQPKADDRMGSTAKEESNVHSNRSGDL